MTCETVFQLSESLKDKLQSIENAVIPKESELSIWVNNTLSACLNNTDERENSNHKYSVTIRLVTSQESQELNKTYRNKDYPTNVLSFTSELPDFIDITPKPLGDLVLCFDVVNKESIDQQKQAVDHWAHLVTHGCLHLLGYDHQTDDEATEMEAIEVKLLGDMDIKNPYI